MQTAPSAITGFTAPASGGKLPSKNEDQRDDTAGFATSLRSAMPGEDTPQTLAQQAAESAKSKTGETIDASEDREPSEASKGKRNRAPHNEQTPVRALKAASKSPSRVSMTAFTQPATVDAGGASDAKATHAKQSDRAPELVESLTTELPDMKQAKAEETISTDESIAVGEPSATEAELETDVRVNPNRPAREPLEQANNHTTALSDSDSDSGDSPPLRESVVQSPVKSATGPSGPSEPGTEVTDPLPVRDSAAAPTDQKPGSPQAVSPTTVAAASASKATNPQPLASDTIVNTASSNGAVQAKSERAESQTAATGQVAGRQASSKAKAPTIAASTQDKSVQASLASSPATRSAEAQGNVPGKALAASHRKSRPGAKTIHGAGDAPGAKAKANSLKTATGDALTLKQTATGGASPAEVGVDRVALTGSRSASKLPATGSDPSASLTNLPDIDAPLDPADVSEAFQGQLGERLVMAVRNDMTRAEIRINPNELGPITIELHIDGNTAAVNFGAENNNTRNALQDSLPSLRDQLAREGLTLGESSVGGQPNRSSDQNDREQQSAQWTELRSDSSEQAEEHVLPDGYRPAQPARGLVDLFA